MKVRKLPVDALLEVGDMIKCEHMGGGTNWYKVTRVTPKYAFAKVNDTYEVKFPRVHSDYGFCDLPRQTWSTTTYSAWRPVDEQEKSGTLKSDKGVAKK